MADAGPGASPAGRRVRVLPDTLVDQIAAGEVVERPASVVKELVENALDAGAARIGVELRDGGRAWIAVTDDGCGMSPEDARMALRRHATSKLASAGDLDRIQSLGFRGEALPAIASVSRFRLRTRAAGAAGAVELRAGVGRAIEERAAGAPVGTRVEVAELFASVPARRKFLKTAVTEWGHAAAWLARIALANPGVHFDVRRDDRPAIAWPAASDLADRVAAVLSEDVAAALTPVSGEAGDLALRGFASRPDFHRPTASGIHLFVDRRPVRDRLVRHALLEVYRELLPRGRYPCAILFLELPTGAVDVNVHPAKWEVRFADPQAVHALVRRSLRAAVAQRAWLGRPETPRAAPGAVRRPGRWQPERTGSARPPGQGDWVFAIREAPAGGDERPAAKAAADPGAIRFGELRCVGQLFATYLVVEGKEALLLVDQHAAHERVLYERLRAQRLAGGVERQPLLFTASVELEPALHAALLAATDAALELGLEVEPFGESAVAVRAVPSLLAGCDPAALLRGLADEIASPAGLGVGVGGGSRLVDALDDRLATMACHAARRAGERLDSREQRALLDALDTIPWAPTCPHGRPVAVPFELHEIERRFARRYSPSR